MADQVALTTVVLPVDLPMARTEILYILEVAVEGLTEALAVDTF